jgi:hypothetical protein
MAKLKGSYRLDQCRWCWISGLQCAPPEERKAELTTIERNVRMLRAVCSESSIVTWIFQERHPWNVTSVQLGNKFNPTCWKSKRRHVALLSSLIGQIHLLWECYVRVLLLPSSVLETIKAILKSHYLSLFVFYHLQSPPRIRSDFYLCLTTLVILEAHS